LTLALQPLILDAIACAETMDVSRRMLPDTREWQVASRLTAISKESGVGDERVDAYAARRAELDERFHALPPVGTEGYWRHIEQAPAEEALPLEVLTRCIRERVAAGQHGDAQRIFAAIMGRIQQRTAIWAWRIASQARGGMAHELKDELQQECYLKLWQELTDEGPTFLMENALHALTRIEQHVAHDVMERAGEWQRPGVDRPNRVPRSDMESADALAEREEDGRKVPLEISDTTAGDAFERVEWASDLLDALRELSAEMRSLIYDSFVRELTQEDIARKWNVTDRTVRNRLKQSLEHLRVRLGDEEGRHA
jgi:RNA polymerase sigma factor (sigma-70 family)